MLKGNFNKWRQCHF